MKKILFLWMFFYILPAIGAPIPSSNGGNNYSNSDAYHIVFKRTMIFPDDINLQSAYENDPIYPQSRINLPSNGEISVINELNETVFDLGAHYGAYSEVGFSGSFNVGNFGIGINTVDQASTFFSVSPVDNDVGFGTLPYPDFSSAAESTIDLTHAPKGLSVYNINDNTLDIYDGVFRKLLSTNHISANNNATVTANDDGTVIIGTTGLALDSAVVHNTGNETIAGTKTFSSPMIGDILGVASNANSVSTLSITAVNTDFYVPFFASVSNSYQQTRLFSGFTFNPSSNTISASANIADNSVVYQKLQQVNVNRLLGNPTGSVANAQEILLGNTLQFSTGALQTLAMTGDIITSVNSFSTSLATVNSNSGTLGDATHTLTINSDAKGRILSVLTNLITPAGIGAPTTTGTGASGSWGISITGNAVTATNGVVTTGSYADPSWITSLSAAKLSGTIPTSVLGNIPKITVTSYLAAGSYTYTTPTGVTHICVQGWGSGAGGGGAAGTVGQTAAGSGGGGGAGFYKCISSPLSSYAVVVAAGGGGGAAGANNGSAGGTTIFGTSLLTAPGGNGGLGATSSITATILQGGGTQGTATGGDLNSNGNPGGVSITLGSSATQVKAGDGGQGGLTGTISRGPMNADGAAGSFCGSGGSGGATSNATSRAGAAGYNGCIIVYEYYNG